jgi:hypothetical protein
MILLAPGANFARHGTAYVYCIIYIYIYPRDVTEKKKNPYNQKNLMRDQINLFRGVYKFSKK